MFMTKREKWLIYGLMILATLVTVVPFIWMIITSFKTQAESIAFPPILLPANPGFQAYGKILHEMPFGSFYFNSIVSTLVIVILQTLIAAMAAYGFSRLRFKGR
ncbi:TPA: carbohydrate ABC transporter permease, partial [Citrobacter freundii]